MHGPLRRRDAIGDRGRRQHEPRRVAVKPADGERKVALLAFRRNAGRGAAAHHVDDDDRDLGADRETDAFGHQREARSRGRREGGHAAVRRADDHVDGGELVLGLQQRAADLRERGRHPFEQLGRRRDRVGGDEAHAAADRAQPRRLVAGDEPALAATRRAGRDAADAIDAAPRGDAPGERLEVGLRAARRRASTIRAARLPAPRRESPRARRRRRARPCWSSCP